MDKQLYQFLLVAELGSVSGAAEKLGVSQPTVSATLRKLEQKFGVPLIDRLSKGVRLTEFGERVKLDAADARKREIRLHADLSNLKSRRAGSLKIGTGDAWWDLFVKNAWFEFQQRHPSTGLHLETGNHLRLMDLLVRDQIDLFVGHEIAGLSCRQPVFFTPLFFDDEALFVREGHPLLLAKNPARDINQFPLVRVTPDCGHHRYLIDDPLPKQSELDQKQVSGRIVYNTSSLSSGLDLLATGNAVMPYPASMASLFSKQGIVPLAIPGARGSIGYYIRRTLAREIESETREAGEQDGKLADFIAGLTAHAIKNI